MYFIYNKMEELPIREKYKSPYTNIINIITNPNFDPNEIITDQYGISNRTWVWVLINSNDVEILNFLLNIKSINIMFIHPEYILFISEQKPFEINKRIYNHLYKYSLAYTFKNYIWKNFVTDRINNNYEPLTNEQILKYFIDNSKAIDDEIDKLFNRHIDFDETEEIEEIASKFYKNDFPLQPLKNKNFEDLYKNQNFVINYTSKQ